jgi:[acyl-carrier-protein] S-malonyltransferase
MPQSADTPLTPLAGAADARPSAAALAEWPAAERADGGEPATGLMFPGQGSHVAGMDEPHRDSDLFERGLEVLGEDPFPDLGESTRSQQPAVFLCSVCAWDAAGRPAAVAALGHSLGEYAALVAAGALEFEDAVRLVDRRAEAMAEAGAERPGGMVAMLGGRSDAVEALAGELELTIANDNAPGQVVLSGDRDRIDEAAERAQEAGARARVLAVGGAFHSPAMEPALEPLRAALAEVSFREPRFPVISCGTAAPFEDPASELAANLVRPVRWRETVLAALDDGVESFRELGPGGVLTKLVKRIDSSATVEAAAA